MEPQIRTEKGYTTVEVTVQLGFEGYLFAMPRIAEQCRGYPGHVLLERTEPLVDGDGKIRGKLGVHDIRDCFRLLQLGPEPGETLQIRVEGTDEAAETLALRLYSGLSSTDSFNLDFSRHRH